MIRTIRLIRPIRVQKDLGSKMSPTIETVSEAVAAEATGEARKEIRGDTVTRGHKKRWTKCTIYATLCYSRIFAAEIFENQHSSRAKPPSARANRDFWDKQPSKHGGSGKFSPSIRSGVDTLINDRLEGWACPRSCAVAPSRRG